MKKFLTTVFISAVISFIALVSFSKVSANYSEKTCHYYLENQCHEYKSYTCIYNGGCPEVTPTDTPTPTPDFTPTPTAGESATLTPTPTCGDKGCGWGNVPSGQGSSAYTPNTCNGIYSSSALLQGFHRDNPTTVTFSWWLGNKSDHQAIVYGYASDKLVYGANLNGNVTSFTIQDLQPNVMVWGQIWTYSGECLTKSNLLDP